MSEFVLARKRTNLRLVEGGPGHDLPPRWDGHPVWWRGWRDRGATFICGHQVDVCEHCGRGDVPAECECGSHNPPMLNQGMVGESADMTPQDVERNDEAIRLARSAGVIRNAPQRIGWLQLTAFRCPDCGADRVVDGDGVLWDLDETDYGDDGSVAP